MNNKREKTTCRKCGKPLRESRFPYKRTELEERYARLMEFHREAYKIYKDMTDLQHTTRLRIPVADKEELAHYNQEMKKLIDRMFDAISNG